MSLLDSVITPSALYCVSVVSCGLTLGLTSMTKLGKSSMSLLIARQVVLIDCQLQALHSMFMVFT